MNVIELRTQRLRLRQWRDDDLPVFAALNAHEEVMAWFPETLSTAASHALAARCRDELAQQGWGIWAVELQASGAFLGIAGLQRLPASFPFAPGIEILWRLHRPYWGHGYATEAARAALHYAFETVGADRVFAFTSLGNILSQAVMERLGMRDSGQHFRHPELSPDHRLSEHVLYSIAAPQ